MLELSIKVIPCRLKPSRDREYVGLHKWKSMYDTKIYNIKLLLIIQEAPYFSNNQVDLHTQFLNLNSPINMKHRN